MLKTRASDRQPKRALSVRPLIVKRLSDEVVRRKVNVFTGHNM